MKRGQSNIKPRNEKLNEKEGCTARREESATAADTIRPRQEMKAGGVRDRVLVFSSNKILL